MKLSVYLNLNGQCATAFKFYERCLGGTITFTQTFADSPMKDQVAPEWGDKIMHTTLVIGDNVLMGADSPPAHDAPPRGMSVSIGGLSPEEGERIFNALSENAEIGMSFQKTFWSPGFGMLTDQFGIPWMINCE